MSEQAGQINAYVCGSQHAVWTRNADDGTTPFIIRCPVPECGREARSAFYRVPQDVDTSHEWYRPTDLRGLTPGERDHVGRGGLLLRQVKPIPGVLGAAFRRPEQPEVKRP
jgi:hypothetical protein